MSRLLANIIRATDPMLLHGAVHPKIQTAVLDPLHASAGSAGANCAHWKLAALAVLGRAGGPGVGKQTLYAVVRIRGSVAGILTHHRREFARQWNGIAAAVVFALFLPNLIWQVRHHFQPSRISTTCGVDDYESTAAPAGREGVARLLREDTLALVQRIPILDV